MDKDTFFDKVYDVVREVPYGRVTSYGAVAAFLGAKSSSRMVGYAMNASSTAQPPVPAHRVVNRFGMLSGKHYFGAPTLMQQLLESEGVKLDDDRVTDFDTVFWDPSLELDLER